MLKSISLPASARLEMPLFIPVFLTVITWGSAFAGIRVALESYTPTHLVLLRHLVASLILVLYALYQGFSLPRWRDVPAFMILGALGFTIYHIALSYGQTRVPAATASFIIASAPVFMALLASFFLGEKLKLWGWLGIAISFGGVAVIAVGRQSGLQIDRWALIVVLSALSQSLYSLGQRPLLKVYTPLQFTTYAMWAGTFMMLPFSGGLWQEMQHAGTEETLAVVYLGIAPSVIGYVMWSSALSRLPAGIAGSVLYMVPPVALIVAWVWLGEMPSLISIIGGAFVLTGVILVNRWGREKRA